MFSWDLGALLMAYVKSVDLTEMAREGKLDPTIGRDEGRYFSSM